MKAACLTPREIEIRLAAAGIRPTAQRIAIAQYVLCEADHPTAEDIKRWADANFPKLSMATVYNTLAVLVRAGLLREFRLSHSSKVIYDDNVDAHHHFLDERSGKLYDIAAEAITVKIDPKLHLDIEKAEVLLRGRRKR